MLLSCVEHQSSSCSLQQLNNTMLIAYRYQYRYILFNLPRRIHNNETMANNDISTFYSLMRKHIYCKFHNKMQHSPNAYILPIFSSACFLDSDFSVHYSKLHCGCGWISTNGYALFVLCQINLFVRARVCVFFFFFMLSRTFIESDQGRILHACKACIASLGI